MTQQISISTNRMSYPKDEVEDENDPFETVKTTHSGKISREHCAMDTG